MIHKPSLFTRSARAITALATVWSLGCCGFEPLVGQLFAAGAGEMADCADGGVATPTTASVDAPQESSDAAIALDVASGSATLSASPAAQPSQDTSCGCDNCQAPSPPVAVAAVIPSLPARALASEVATIPSIVRAPLVPPPQRA